MERIMNETETKAFEYLGAFGFNEDQITTLITQGKKDLHKELTKLQSLIQTDDLDLEEINNVLHALKGLLFQLGNTEVAERLVEIRSDIQNETVLLELKSLLDI